MTPEEELRAHVREIVVRVVAEEQARPLDLKSIAVGADHGGFELKKQLLTLLNRNGYAPIDCGTYSSDPVDYPDIAYAVAGLVSDGTAARGIIIDSAGIGSAMVANKVPGVRAALCYDAVTARNAREHNDANVLTLGARLISPELAREIVTIFLTTACTEERHKNRVAKIMDVERRFLKK